MSQKDYFEYADFVPSSDFRFNIHTARLYEPYFHVHAHEFSEITIILNGAAIHITDVEIHPISTGDVFVLNGDMRHGFNDATGLELCNIIYDPDQFISVDDDISNLAGYHALFMLEPLYRQHSEFRSKLHLEHDELLCVTALISKLIDEYEQRAPGYQSMIRAHFMHLVVYLSRRYQAYRPSKHTWQLAAVMNYIAANYTSSIRLEELATMAHMSTSHFERVFRETFHTSPIDYIIRLRLRKACELMRQPHYSISQIALDVGFGDSNYFARQFKRIIDKTPTEYRRELHNGVAAD